ncbi:SEC-C metal-binding domain-containing protein [Zymomonas mobilis]
MAALAAQDNVFFENQAKTDADGDRITVDQNTALLDAAAQNKSLSDADPAHWVGKISRNAPCPCGSGKRYKHCHGAFTDAKS